MAFYSRTWLLALVMLLVLALDIQISEATIRNKNGIKKAVFLSPKFVMGAGSVIDKYYHNIDFPRGHIALKSFNAEVVDEKGNPVPLQETYLHHWVVGRYNERKNAPQVPGFDSDSDPGLTEYFVRNSGLCQGNSLGQYFGLGSETRKTATYVPDPYGIEIGNPDEIPTGFEEKWLLNIHAIDTRGVEDSRGCFECRCDLYNVSTDGHGRPLAPDYRGGLRCCYDETQCRVRQGIQSSRRVLYLRYTVEWVDWDDSIVPVKIYILDVTDTAGLGPKHNCKVEYDIESCSDSVADSQCIDIKRTRLTMPYGGDVVYGTAHQHAGGIGSALYGQDGRVICSSMPTYGEGKEAGNEVGYIVGMSTCYPQPGSVKIYEGETLVLESNYSRTESHTGVMCLFYILVADPQPRPLSFFHAKIQMLESMKVSQFTLAVTLVGVAMAVLVGVAYGRRTRRDDGYQPVGV